MAKKWYERCARPMTGVLPDAIRLKAPDDHGCPVEIDYDERWYITSG